MYLQCAGSTPNFIQRPIEIAPESLAYQTYVEDLVPLSVQWHHEISCRRLASRSSNETGWDSATGVDTRAGSPGVEFMGLDGGNTRM